MKKFILLIVLIVGFVSGALFGKFYLEYQDGLSLADAAHVLRKEAKDGNLNSQYVLGELLLSGLNVTEEHKKEAFMWMKKAADQDHFKAQFKVAEMFEKGIGVEQDEKQAQFYYEEAAETILDEADI